MFNDPAGSRMPPPNRRVFVSGYLVVLACVVVLAKAQRGAWPVVLFCTGSAALQMWRSPFGRFVRRRIRVLCFAPRAPQVIVALHARWNARRIVVEELATRREILAFERHTGVAMPEDLRCYFTLVNGTTPSDYGRDDGYGVRFWPLNGVSSFADMHVGSGPDAERTYAFAHWSMDVVYGVRLGVDPAQATPVFASLPSGQVQVAASFSEFVEGYLRRPRFVLFPEFDVVAREEGVGTEYDGVFTCSVRWQDVRLISITLVSREDRTTRAVWVIKGDKPLSPLHELYVDVVLTARATALTERLRAFPGFDDDAFRAAVAAERRDEAGTFVCWRHPDFREEPSAMTV